MQSWFGSPLALGCISFSTLLSPLSETESLAAKHTLVSLYFPLKAEAGLGHLCFSKPSPSDDCLPGGRGFS